MACVVSGGVDTESPEHVLACRSQPEPAFSSGFRRGLDQLCLLKCNGIGIRAAHLAWSAKEEYEKGDLVMAQERFHCGDR